MSLDAVEAALQKSEQYHIDITELKSLEYLIELAEQEKLQMMENTTLDNEMKQNEVSHLDSTLEILRKKFNLISDRLFES